MQILLKEMNKIEDIEFEVFKIDNKLYIIPSATKKDIKIVWENNLRDYKDNENNLKYNDGVISCELSNLIEKVEFKNLDKNIQDEIIKIMKEVNGIE